MKNKYLVIRFICVLAAIILAMCHFIVKIDNKKLMPFIIIDLLILQIFDDRSSKRFQSYTKYNGLKIILSCILFFWIIAIAISIFHK
ncbi:hypothetical protein [Clostridium scatologenes]|uniref:Uncharacterized protein n=1 Tax=Clostridium scatologenes TaxID=1548 RepID=A0A0E3M8X5_CLOSL|nr:hypothetical protein [Clostridium scatologenes]AKA72057.1 hypothetical protein CSCA_4932 [Clostridium scatologenes]